MRACVRVCSMCKLYIIYFFSVNILNDGQYRESHMIMFKYFYLKELCSELM